MNLKKILYKLPVVLGLYKYTNERERDNSPAALQMGHKEY